MKVAIMQPYFFPYLGYFSLIKQTDKFILLDEVQFIRHGWIERNRILKPQGGWQYIAVPLVKHKRETRIKDINIRQNTDWRGDIERQLEHYKKRAPYYSDTMMVVKKALDIETPSIVVLNQHILDTVCDYIGFKPSFHIFSEMNMRIEDVKAPDEWALNICKALGNVEEYWNPEGGLDFFHKDKYSNQNILINFLKINLREYNQKNEAFEAGLSIVDVMMFNSPDRIKDMLDDYSLD